MTEHDYDGHLFCAHQDTEEARGGLCKWDMRPARVGVYSHINSGELGTLSANGVRGAIKKACERWEEVCGIQFFYPNSAREAHIVIGAGIQREGPGGTLAWSELPCGPDRQLQQQYDRRERWVIADNPPRGSIDLIRVVCHEIGHAIGISHIGSGNLLAPTYSSRIKGPQAGDIVEAQARYGRPQPKEDPQPDPDPVKPENQIKLILSPDGVVRWE